MRFIDRARHAWRALFRRRQLEQDLDEELRAWVDELSERHRARGSSPAEARRLALAELGNVESVRQAARDVRPASGLDGTAQDVRDTWRALRRAPGFTGVAVLTLALGIGATTAIFSAVNALLIAPLPYRDASRLIFVWTDMTSSGYPRVPLSGPELADLRQRSTLVEGFGAIWATGATLTGDGDPEQLRTGLVTTNFFTVLGADAAYGRTFGPSDDEPAAAPGIVLSWALWHRRFGADPSVVGRRIQVSGRPVTVLGVMPENFRLLMPADASVPADLQAWQPLKSLALPRVPRGQQYLRVIGRMRPGVTVAQAGQEIATIAGSLSREFAEYGSAGRAFTTVGLQADGVREVRPFVLALFGGVLILLVIACVNVAGLLVARAAARSREIAVRMALGAGTSRLVRHCLAEGLMLALMGGAAGLFVGWLGLRVLLLWRPAGLARMTTAHIDLNVLALTFGVALVWGLLFSLAPLAETLRANVAHALRRDGQRVSGGMRHRTRAVLVVVQVGLGVVLLIGAGLLVRAFVQLQRVDAGLQPDHVLTFRVAPSTQRLGSRDALDDFSRRLHDALAALPAVTGVGAISHVPFDEQPNWGGQYVTNPTEDPAAAPNADYRSVSPGFFESAGAQLLDGREFTEADNRTGPPSVVVDDLLARRAWPGERAIGKSITLDPGSSGRPSVLFTVVGVVRHIRLRSLVEDLSEQVYFPVRQVLRSPMAYLVRSSADPDVMATAVRQTVTGLDPLLPVYDIRPLDTYFKDAKASRRFTMILAVCFAGVALVLASVGVYGVIAYAVTRRRTEFGIRLALGARPAQVVGAVLGEGARLVGAGLALGCLGALVAGSWLRSQLYGVTPLDPAAYGCAFLALAIAAFLSCWVPARRLTSSSPLDALRSE